MDLLESNLSREGVEELEWAKGPIQVRDEQTTRVHIYGLALVAAILSTVAGVGLFSLPLCLLSGLTSVISGGLCGRAAWNRWQGESYLALWQQWKEEGALQTEVDRLQKQLQELKSSPYTGPRTTWFSWLFSYPYHLVKDSAIGRDSHWKNLCDDLASATAQVGTLSTQSDRAHNFRSHLLHVVRESAATLAIVAADVTDSDSWMALLERKFEIAHLLSWMREPAPLISDSYPSSLAELVRTNQIAAFFVGMAHRNLSKTVQAKKGGDGNAAVLAAGAHLGYYYSREQLNKEIVRSYKTRISALAEE